ncbi:hypothetical protein T09_951 [Trichinella sp. T9]|nr:hypothetical protein T09_951 [Trichinella sp. T9]
MEFVLPKFYSNVDYYQTEEDCEDINGRRLSVMTSRIGRPSDGPLQVQPSLLIPNPLLWSCTSRTTMPWPNIAYSAHHYWGPPVSSALESDGRLTSPGHIDQSG